jgi:Holliday junction resolvasome RuvABC endonuclease subunit|tara:strand:- start:1127 stop:1726 length:600 start_codon:yes stop_codon:yes gene_type:complete
MAILEVVGFDPSLRNWGIATGEYCLDNARLQITGLAVTKPVLPKGKQVRQNSKDLDASFQLAEGALSAAQGADAIFVEVPVGSQSSRAMASYGMCNGILGALRAFGIPFFEVTPTEVKLISVGDKKATKQEMISWATSKHPEAPWPTKKVKGGVSIVEGTAEHMADAVAAIYAGLATSEFKQAAQLMGRISNARKNPCK